MAGTVFTTTISSTVTGHLANAAKEYILVSCVGTPPATASVFAKGCIAIQSNASSNAVWQNNGTYASPSWDLIGSVSAGEISLAEGSLLVGNSSGVATALATEATGNILVGDGTTLASVAVSGDIALATNGTMTIANQAITNSKVADSDGTAGLDAPIKYATVVYDFDVDGGTAGTVALTGSPTIPDNAIVHIDSYDVITTLTSSTDAATVKLQLPTDGDLSTAVAISNGGNPWDAGANYQPDVLTPVWQKTTAARVPELVIAGGENVTAGKVIFKLAYYISE